MEVKKLSVTELRRQDQHDPIWVINGTMRDPKNRANVVVNMPIRDGEAQDPIHVWATWVPICLTDKVDRAALLRSRHFLMAMERELLFAISQEEAERLMRVPGAREEMERVRKLNINNVTGDAMGSIGDEESTAVEIQMPDGETLQDDPISASVHQYIGLMEAASGMEALNSLRNLGDLSLEEYQAIAKEARGLGDSHKEVLAFCREKIQTLRPNAPAVTAGGQSKRVL